MRPAYSTPPSLDDIEAMARWALASVPGTFRQYAANLVIRVEDFVDEETEEEMDLESPFELLGLYRGVSLNNKSVSVSSQDMDMVFLYRRPILDYWCETGEDLAHLVRHVLIHEIGHHFGLSDDDMDAIEDQA